MIINYNRFFLLFFLLAFLFTGVGISQPSYQSYSPNFYIQSITIEGNSKSDPAVVFENLSFGIGDSLTEEKIHEDIDRLRNLELFRDVNFQPRAGSRPGNLHLIIQVEERYWPIFRFKGGFSELDSWYLTPIGLHFDNIFGYGNFTNIDFTIGDRIASFKFNHINPNIFDSDLDFHFRIYVHNREFIHYIEGLKLSQQVPQSGLFLGLQSREGFFKHFLFGMDFYSTKPDSFATYSDTGDKYYTFPDHIAQFVKEETKIASFSIFMNLDLRDQAAYPTKGWWLGIWFTQADQQLGGQVEFSRFIIDIRKYQYIVDDLVVAARLKAGTISPQAPFFEKFYLGGPNSLRGYADRSLSPPGGGDRIYQAGLEIRLPVSRKRFPHHFLTGILFVDLGANQLENQTLDKLNGSYGFGLRFLLPFLGLIRMDLGYPFKGEKMIQFSLGHTF